MTQQTLLDPFALWMNMYQKAEENLSETFNAALQREEFSEFLGNVQSSYLQYQKLVQTTTDTYLKHINMPTREEISNIASLIINVEEKVDSLDQRVEDELLTNSSEIGKLKTYISKLDKKMDQILKFMEQDQKSPAPSSTKEPK